MSATQRCCFVLWGDQCDEVAAILFIANLRERGMRVWVVGIGGKRNRGAHGLGLITDLALDQALPLANQAVAVIVPCRSDQWRHFCNDPRLVTFLQSCLAHHARLLMAADASPISHSQQDKSAIFSMESIELYPTGDTLLAFVKDFATDVGSV